MARFWPPTKSCGLSILWSLSLGFLLQLAVPALFTMLGAEAAATWAMLPGLWPILWSTGGWFAGITPLGYAFIYAINTAFYGVVLLAGFRICAFVQRRQPQNSAWN